MSRTLMFIHHAAFLAAAMTTGLSYETRDGEPTNAEIKTMVEKIGTTFEEAKSKNDERLKQLEERGASDPLTTEALKKITDEMAELKSVKDDMAAMQKRMSRPGAFGGGDTVEHTKEEIEHRDKFVAYMRNATDHQRQAEVQTAERDYLSSLQKDGETRSVSTLQPGTGGFAVPEIISRQIARELSEVSPLRNEVRTITAGSKDYKELVDVRGTSFGWVGETDARDETDTPGLQEVAPTFGTIYAYPKASEESLDDIFFNVPRWLIDGAVEAFSEGEENAIINGNGVKKPTGLLAALQSDQEDGVRPFGTIQTRASGNAAGFAAEHPFDALRTLVYDLKKGYRRNAKWLMNKATAGQVMLFKDGDGNYLWQTSATLDQPDRLAGYAVLESEEMPDVAANSTPIGFGDLKKAYVLVDLVSMRITRDEVTEPGYVKFYIRKREGGIVKVSEAYKLLKMAA